MDMEKSRSNMNRIKEYKYFILTMLILAIVIMLPPLLYRETYLVINNDTAAHLAVFEVMKSGTANYLYLGQMLTGWLMVGIESIFGIDISISFMWFNFTVLFLAGMSVAIMVVVITNSKLAGIISAFLITFGTSSTMHLFYSGTIFNIIEILIIFPILISLVYLAMIKRKTQWLFAIMPIGILLFFFHPSLGMGVFLLFEKSSNPEVITTPISSLLLFFGIVNLLVLALCGIAIKTRNNKEKIKVETKIIMAFLLSLTILFIVITLTNITPFSARMLYNTLLVLGLLLCILIGITLKYNNSWLVKTSVTSLALAGTVGNLVGWLSFPNYREVINIAIS